MFFGGEFIIYKKYISIIGANQTCSFIYAHPICVSRCVVADQIVQANFDTLSVDAGRYDWNSKIVGHVFHATGAKDFGRHNAGNDKTSGSR